MTSLTSAQIPYDRGIIQGLDLLEENDPLDSQ